MITGSIMESKESRLRNRVKNLNRLVILEMDEFLHKLNWIAIELLIDYVDKRSQISQIKNKRINSMKKKNKKYQDDDEYAPAAKKSNIVTP